MNNNFFKVTAFVVTIFSLISCSSKAKVQDKKELIKHKNALNEYNLILSQNKKKSDAIKKYVSELSLEEKIAQIFMINLERDDEFLPVEWYERTITLEDGTEKKVKATLFPAGYIFFGYNISKNPKQIISFTDSIKKTAAKENAIPPFLSIDAEGGFVNRLRGVAGPLPENERVAQCLFLPEAYQLYSLYAIQLNKLGFNLNLAPVAEINSETNKDFLSGRSYGTKNQVTEYCSKAINAYQNKKVGTVLKHFPGNTNVDPHIGLPKIDMSENELFEVKQVFSNAIKEKPAGVLMSHAIVPNYDKNPSCLSEFWILKTLRQELGFDGIIFSDDIFMGALINNGYSPKKASKLAIESGINCIMISEKKFGQWMKMLEKICLEDSTFLSKIESSAAKMIEFKILHNLLKIEYDKKSDTYKVMPYNINELDFSPENQLKRFNDFNTAKEQNIALYNKYFLSSASEEEKKCLYIK